MCEMGKILEGHEQEWYNLICMNWPLYKEWTLGEEMQRQRKQDALEIIFDKRLWWFGPRYY